MKNHSKDLQNKKESKGECGYTDEMVSLSEDHNQYVKELLDPLIVERNQAKLLFETRFITPFTIALKKFNVLKKINIEVENKIKDQLYPLDTVMLMLYEDSVKYCAISFCEVIRKLIIFLNGELQGKFLHLLRRNSLKSTVEKLSKDNTENDKKYTIRLSDYQKIWDAFFQAEQIVKTALRNKI
ncbi:MAG: hypothetical protein JSR46_08440 [Verrucomicrobia bacterium]|nr:hypothetical protein [Verrucomicrobiota bacterium]